MKAYSRAGCALAVFLVCLLAHEAQCGTDFILGGEYVGWTNKADVDYDEWVSRFKIKIGDTLVFANVDSIDHSIVQVDKLGYESCGAQGVTYGKTTIGSDIQSRYTFPWSGNFYAICDIQSHCFQGMRVHVQVLNYDGSVNITDEIASAPKANAASDMPVLSWTSQLLVLALATVTLRLAVMPVLG